MVPILTLQLRSRTNGPEVRRSTRNQHKNMAAVPAGIAGAQGKNITNVSQHEGTNIAQAIRNIPTAPAVNQPHMDLTVPPGLAAPTLQEQKSNRQSTARPASVQRANDMAAATTRLKSQLGAEARKRSNLRRGDIHS